MSSSLIAKPAATGMAMEGTTYASIISGITIKGQRDDPNKFTIWISFPDGTEKLMFDNIALRDMGWMEQVQHATGLQRFHFLLTKQAY